jgi:hypothetical protein
VKVNGRDCRMGDERKLRYMRIDHLETALLLIYLMRLLLLVLYLWSSRRDDYYNNASTT